MAWFSQEMKREMAPKVKKILEKHDLKGRLSVDNHSTLVLKITEGGIKIDENYIQVNQYHLEFYQNNPKLYSFLQEISLVLNEGNWDKSDIQVDYFNVGWYVDINFGTWNKHYIYTGKEN